MAHKDIRLSFSAGRTLSRGEGSFEFDRVDVGWESTIEKEDDANAMMGQIREWVNGTLQIEILEKIKKMREERG